MNQKLKPVERPTSSPWIDATIPIRPEMPVWPGQPDVQVKALESIDAPGEASVTCLQMSAHTGTHIDAPNHFIKNDADITAWPIDLTAGRVRVCRVQHTDHLIAEDLTAYERRTRPIEPDEKVFFRSSNSDTNWATDDFDEHYAAISPSLARLLVERGVGLAGVDYLSVAPFEDPATTHRLLLHAGVWVLEGLKLIDIDEGEYDYIAAPLSIVGSDAAPARVLLRPSHTSVQTDR